MEVIGYALCIRICALSVSSVGCIPSGVITVITFVITEAWRSKMQFYEDETTEIKEGDMVSLKRTVGGSPLHVQGAIGIVSFEGGNIQVTIYSGPDDDWGKAASVAAEDLNFIMRG